MKGPPGEGHYRKDLSDYEGESVDSDVSAYLVRGGEGLDLDPSTFKSYINVTLD